MFSKIRSFLIPFVALCIVFGTAATIIAYGRGYRFDFGNRALNATGLVVLQSEPSGAQILVDGEIKSATQATLTLSPGWYDITIVKEGFQPWKKHVNVQGEVVNKIEALLLPINPSLTALTVSGVVSPALSPDGSKLAYIVPDQPQATISGALSPTRPGIWILDLTDKPLSLNRDAKQIAQSNGIDFAGTRLAWSPDNKQLVAVTHLDNAYLLDTEKLNDPLNPTSVIQIQAEWATIKEQRTREQFATIPLAFTNIASESAVILSLAPDETKILYEATAPATLPRVITPPLIGTNSTNESRTITPHHVYVYDIKEDRNYHVGETSQFHGMPIPTPPPARGIKLAQRDDQFLFPDASLSLQWLPSSRHLVFISKDKVQIMDYDGTNIRTAYAGPFWDSFAVPWASGGKLVILTNLNSTASAVNNLYLINLR